LPPAPACVGVSPSSAGEGAPTTEDAADAAEDAPPFTSGVESAGSSGEVVVAPSAARFLRMLRDGAAAGVRCGGE
jgi:hypothetical protein